MTRALDTLEYDIRRYSSEKTLSNSEKAQHICEAALHYADKVHGFKPETWQQYQAQRSKHFGRGV